MKKFYQLLLLTVLGTGSAQAALLTFDNIPSGSIQGGLGQVQTYQGFNFSFTFFWFDLVGSGWPYGAHSGDFAVVNESGGVGTITKTDLSDFTFDGLWAKKWNTPTESGGAASLFGTIKGFNNGLEVWSIATALNGSYQFIGGKAQPIDELRLGMGDLFIVDDLALNQGTNSVPEPSVIALFGWGFASFRLAKYRHSIRSPKR